MSKTFRAPIERIANERLERYIKTLDETAVDDRKDSGWYPGGTLIDAKWKMLQDEHEYLVKLIADGLIAEHQRERAAK